MIYLSSTFSLILPQYRDRFGYMLSAMKQSGAEDEAVHYPWMLDNGIFTGKWREDVWLHRLEQLQPYRQTCIAAVVPDALYDLAGTLERWQQYAKVVRGFGFRAAFVTQNGCAPGDIPTDADVLFIGGDDNHKLHESWPLIAEAKQRGMWVHIGRVNSMSRMRQFAVADSCDGTHLHFEPTRQRQENIWRTSLELRTLKAQPDLWSMPV